MAEEYDASMIEILKGLEPVKRRPGMYVGDTDDGSGLVHMLMEVVSNCIDQFLSGSTSFVSVTLHENGDVEVVDDGAGMPLYEIDGKSALEQILTSLHHRATWDGHRPHMHVGGIHGVGIAVVNALSDYLEVDTYQESTHWHMGFKESEAGTLENKGRTDKTGTRILFHPSNKYFSSLAFDEEAITSRFQELAFLCSGLKISFRGKGKGQIEYFCPSGLVGYLEHILPAGSKPSSPILHFESVEKETRVELALGWAEGEGYQRSFANYLCTKDGGVHVEAVTKGLEKALEEFRGCDNISAKNILEGLYFIVHVNVADPYFAGPTKDRLINKEVYEAVFEATVKQGKKYITENPSIWDC